MEAFKDLAAVGVQPIGDFGRDGEDILEVVRSPRVSDVHAHRMLIEREVDGIGVGQRESGIGEQVVEHGCPRSLSLLHVNLAGLDEIAAVGAAGGVDAEALLQAVAAVLVQLVVAEVGEAGVRHRPGNEERRFIQVEAGSGGSGLRRRIAGVRNILVFRYAALQENCEGIGETEL